MDLYVVLENELNSLLKLFDPRVNRELYTILKAGITQRTIIMPIHLDERMQLSLLVIFRFT